MAVDRKSCPFCSWDGNTELPWYSRPIEESLRAEIESLRSDLASARAELQEHRASLRAKEELFKPIPQVKDILQRAIDNIHKDYRP